MCMGDEDSAHSFGTQKLDFGFEFGLVYWMSSYPEFGHFPHSWSGTGFAGQQDFLSLSVKSHVRLPQYHRSIFLEVSLGKFRVYSMRKILAMEWKHPWAWGKIGCFLWRTQSAFPPWRGRRGARFSSLLVFAIAFFPSKNLLTSLFPTCGFLTHYVSYPSPHPCSTSLQLFWCLSGPHPSSLFLL